MNPQAFKPFFRVLDPGLGASIQDRGRLGWRRFGVPVSGWMDAHAASAANRLLDNDDGAAVIEFLFHGARIEVLEPAWIAVTGADLDCSIPIWRAYHASAGEIIHLRGNRSGVWSYLAVEGGIDAPTFFGSASYYARGEIGMAVARDTLIARGSGRKFSLPQGVAGRVASWSDRWDYSAPPRIRAWPGPQWKLFPSATREMFLTTDWKISPQSDRVGYRLEGPALKATTTNIVSEPVQPGSVQVPENGQPIITMNDGPTVGGYPKIVLIDAANDLPWVAQSRPGQTIRFQLLHDA